MNGAWVAWWDAVAIARAEAAFTGVRQRVTSWLGGWLVEAVS